MKEGLGTNEIKNNGNTTLIESMYQIWQASIIWFLFLSFGIGLQGPCVTVQAELSIPSRRQTKQKFMQNQVKSLERKSLLIFFIFVFLC